MKLLLRLISYHMHTLDEVISHINIVIIVWYGACGSHMTIGHVWFGLEVVCDVGLIDIHLSDRVIKIICKSNAVVRSFFLCDGITTVSFMIWREAE